VTADDAGLRGTRGQTAPLTKGSQEERTKRTRGEEIEHDIKMLRDIYGQKPGRAAKPVPFIKVDAVFRKIDEVTRFLRVNDACKRVEEMVKDIEKVAGKIDDRWKQASAPRSYAHVTRVGNTGVVLGAGVETPPTARPRDKRRIVVRIASKEEAEALREQTREDIVSRIQLTADEAYTNHKVVAI